MTTATILVVDDSPANLKLVAFVLRAYRVRTATDAEAAVVSIAEVRPDLILMDLQLPGIDGLELTRRLKSDATTRAIPVIAVTAYAMAGDEARARAVGCDAYVTKPIDTRALPQIVAEHLAR